MKTHVIFNLIIFKIILKFVNRKCDLKNVHEKVTTQTSVLIIIPQFTTGLAKILSETPPTYVYRDICNIYPSRNIGCDLTERQTL